MSAEESTCMACDNLHSLASTAPSPPPQVLPTTDDLFIECLEAFTTRAPPPSLPLLFFSSFFFNLPQKGDPILIFIDGQFDRVVFNSKTSWWEFVRKSYNHTGWEFLPDRNSFPWVRTAKLINFYFELMKSGGGPCTVLRNTNDSFVY